MTEGFIRQRRNLIITNIIIIFLALAKVKIEQLSVAGVQFGAFENPEILLLFLWVTWAYFLYRYSVYFLEEGPSNLLKTWRRDFEATVNPRIKSLVYRAYDKPNDGCAYSYWGLRHNGYIYNGQAYEQTEGNEERMFNFKLPVYRRQIILWEAMAFLRFSIFSPPITDYILGFVLSFGVATYCGFILGWGGNILNLLQ
ncbi:hypothetical protein [Halomonas aestuarii]|uniref:hypothetical protein n=1 Tax=Halomonas aestuarii TaxID=1897729 RepID=UPI000F77E379|nr:hypothetical protein [Halomonas aestuarii]